MQNLEDVASQRFQAVANDAFGETLKNRNNASSGNALPTITIHNQPPCSYTALATEEPKAPPMKMLVMYLSLIHI